MPRRPRSEEKSPARLSGPVAVLRCLLAGFFSPAFAQTNDYVLGQGLNVGAFNVAGYATIEAQSKSGEQAGLIVDDLSLFIKGAVNKAINPFLEAEIAEADLWSEGARPFAHVAPRLDIERLYNDFIVNEHVTFRVGKMLSPVGEWNTIHAGPLVWTTTRPLTSFRNYSEFASGVSLIAEGLGDNRLRVEAYWQPSGDIDGPDPAPALYQFRHTAGLHVEWALGLTDKLGVSLQSAAIRGTLERQLLVGLNGRLTFGRLEVESELTWTSLHHPLPQRRRHTEYGGYLQGAYGISDQWFLIGRAESFRDRDFDGTSQNFVAGVNYRPRSPIVWKVEYVRQGGRHLGISTGLISSFNVLF